MKFFFCISFLVASCRSSVGIIREYSYHYEQVGWNRAQNSCRAYYKDLATVTTAEEHQRLVGLGINGVSAWIGLYRTDEYQNWTWSDGEEVSFSNWYNGSPLTGPGTENRNFVAVYNGKWINEDNAWPHPFYCYKYLILVTESKTWEEALQYCSTHYTGLASMPNNTQLLQARNELALTQTINVWTGLRFMNGQWFWVSREPLGTLVSLPSCPARPKHCGTLNTATNTWENRDCDEKWNFLCHWS